MKITLEVPRLPMPPNAYDRLHWSARSREIKRWRQDFWAAYMKYLPTSSIRYRQDVYCTLPERRRVLVTLYGSRLRDRDDVFRSLKPVLDALRPVWKNIGGKRIMVSEGWIWDDSMKWIDLADPVIVKSKEKKTVVTIESV